MKRSQITRRTELKRKKPLRRVSLKRSNVKRQTDPARKQYLEDHPVCEVYRCQRRSREVHEIARGNARERALWLPRLWFAVCRDHHDAFDDFVAWPPARQLATKYATDIGEAVWELNDARDRSQSAVKLADVVAYLEGIT